MLHKVLQIAILKKKLTKTQKIGFTVTSRPKYGCGFPVSCKKRNFE
jgi:hypothetical protein